MDYIIIVAGGKGLRMGTDIPKQFLPIGGKPVLMRTLERFREYSADLQIILVLPKAQQDYWRRLCEEYVFPLPLEGAGGGFYQLTDGGETRFHSVQHGLALIPDDAEGVVGVHDGVRPFPSVEVIRNCYETAREKKAVIPVIPIVETVRHLIGESNVQCSTFNVQSPFLATTTVWYRLLSVLISNCSRLPTASPTTMDLLTTHLWSKLLANPSLL